MDYQALKTEINGDPLGRGYSLMTDVEISDSLNTKNIEINKTSMSGSEIFEATDSNEYLALTAQDKSDWLSFCGIESHDPFGVSVQIVIGIFGGTSDTVVSLAALRKETISRASELGLSEVKVGDIEYAKVV